MKLSHFSLALAAALATGTAFAQQYTVKVGGAHIVANALSEDLTGRLTLNITGLPTINKAVDSGMKLEVQNQNALVFSIARSLGDNWEAEVLLGIPPKHDVKMRMNNPLLTMLAGLNPANLPPTSSDPMQPTAGQAMAAGHIASHSGKVVSTITQYAPTAFINYKFGTPSSTWRPYLGVGVNYTYAKAKPTAAGTGFYNDGKVRTSISDSWGLAVQAGVNYHIDDTWLISASYVRAQVNSKIRISTDSGETQYGKFKADPAIYMLTVGRKF